jgi:hypothetical protein
MLTKGTECREQILKLETLFLYTHHLQIFVLSTLEHIYIHILIISLEFWSPFLWQWFFLRLEG